MSKTSTFSKKIFALGYGGYQNWYPVGYMTLIKARLRLAIISLTITGLEISEIHYCKVAQIISLLNCHSVPVNVLKRGSSSHN